MLERSARCETAIKICALLGSDLVIGIGGFGETWQEAFANEIDKRSTNLSYAGSEASRAVLGENGVLKAACPECGCPERVLGV